MVEQLNFVTEFLPLIVAGECICTGEEIVFGMAGMLQRQ